MATAEGQGSCYEWSIPRLVVHYLLVVFALSWMLLGVNLALNPLVKKYRSRLHWPNPEEE